MWGIEIDEDVLDTDIPRHYVILSYDVVNGPNIEKMRPDLHGGSFADVGEWIETEDDDSYEFSYLADEMGGDPCRYCEDGSSRDYDIFQIIDLKWATVIGCAPPCEHCNGTNLEGEQYRNGEHRKWVANLTEPQLRNFLKHHCGMDEPFSPGEGKYDHICDTGGSITEFGWMPAYAVENISEGWDPAEFVYGSCYVSEFTLGPVTDLTFPC